jgi:hypothetical protein
MFVNSIQPKKRIEPEVVGDKILKEAAYYAPLNLVIRIGDNLSCSIYLYRDRSGHLLTILNEAIRAILAVPLPAEV